MYNHKKLQSLVLGGMITSNSLGAALGLEQKLDRGTLHKSAIMVQEEDKLKGIYNSLKKYVDDYQKSSSVQDIDKKRETQLAMNPLIDEISKRYGLNADSRTAKVEYDERDFKITYTGFVSGSSLNGKVNRIEFTLHENGTAELTTVNTDGTRVTLNIPAATYQ